METDTTGHGTQRRPPGIMQTAPSGSGIGIFAGSDPQKTTWLEDGSIMIVFREPESAWAVYRIAQGRPAKRLGRLPYMQAEFSVSNDGRYMAEFGHSDKNDVYMIRNFGKMLR